MINIKEKFLKLTSNRTPKGSEANVIKLIPEFKFEKDEFDNYFYIIKKKDGTFSNTMFTSHLDTIDRSPSTYDYKTWDAKEQKWIYAEKENIPSDELKPIIHEFIGDFVKSDGKTNLGADDKAGVTIMLNLMSEGIPGLYYFFMGEESGCVGSSSMSRVYDNKVKEGKLPQVNKCVAFDRRGYESVITEQMGTVCCSDEFAKEIASKLNEYGFWYKPDDTGVYTDSAEFSDIISECTNLSVGYFSEHTTSEKQDLEFLELLAVVLTKIDWENLKIVRDVTNVKYKGKKSYGTGGYANGRYGAGGWDWYGDGYSDGYEDFPLAGRTHTALPPSTTTTTNGAYVDRGRGKLEKFNKEKAFNDDNEFDKWYLEQKNKGWKVEDNKTTAIN